MVLQLMYTHSNAYTVESTLSVKMMGKHQTSVPTWPLLATQGFRTVANADLTVHTVNAVHTVAVQICCCCRVCHSAACKAACNLKHVPTGALKASALYEDSRPRVLKATKEWNWRPLVSVLEHEDVNSAASCPCSLSFCLSCCSSCLAVCCHSQCQKPAHAAEFYDLS